METAIKNTAAPFLQVVSGTFENSNREAEASSLGEFPFWVSQAQGSRLSDADGNEYIDFSTYISDHFNGYPAESESQAYPVNLSDVLANTFPLADTFRFFAKYNHALEHVSKLARLQTGKQKVIFVEGSIPSETYPLKDFHSIYIPYNNPEALSEAFETHKGNVAAVVVSPIRTRQGVLVPVDGYISLLRDITITQFSLLVFDESDSALRIHPSGAQGYFKVNPDLTLLEGNGFAALGGNSDLLSLLDVEQEFVPSNDAVDAFNNNARLVNSDPLYYRWLHQKSRDFVHVLREIGAPYGLVVNAFHSTFSLYFSEKEVTLHKHIDQADAFRYERFRKELFNRGVHLSTQQNSANYIVKSHSPTELNQTLEAIYGALKAI